MLGRTTLRPVQRRGLSCSGRHQTHQDLDHAVRSRRTAENVESYGIFLRSINPATRDIEEEPHKDWPTALTIQLIVGSADEVLINVAGSLSRAFSRFQNELENEEGETVASDLSASLRGTMTDLTYEILGIRLALMERAAFLLVNTDVQSIR